MNWPDSTLHQTEWIGSAEWAVREWARTEAKSPLMAAQLLNARGKTSAIHHDGKTIYKNIPDPFEATRYHSLLINKKSLPDSFEITSWTDEGEIMGIRHKEHLIEGVQFHPESILTKHGKGLLKNFISIAKKK